MTKRVLLFLLFNFCVFGQEVNSTFIKLSIEKDLLIFTFNIKNNWHIYGKDPGDSGMPPKFNFKLQEGVTVSEIAWPATSKHMENDLTTNVYYNKVEFKFKISPSAKKLKGTVEIDWLECKNICVPKSQKFNLNYKDFL